MKTGDLVRIPELDEEGQFVEEGYDINCAWAGADGEGFFDPGPLMIMRTAITDEGRLLIMTCEAGKIHNWDPDDANPEWQYADRTGFRVVSPS